MTITRRRADATVYDDRIITVGNSENFRTSRLHKLSYDIQVVLLLDSWKGTFHSVRVFLFLPIEFRDRESSKPADMFKEGAQCSCLSDG
jgi:hypothetical protein